MKKKQSKKIEALKAKIEVKKKELVAAKKVEASAKESWRKAAKALKAAQAIERKASFALTKTEDKKASLMNKIDDLRFDLEDAEVAAATLAGSLTSSSSSPTV